MTSFVWTHLSNIQESAKVSQIPLQSLLSSLDLQEKFNTDVRKFSRNYEWSALYDPLNIGRLLDWKALRIFALSEATGSAKRVDLLFVQFILVQP